MEPKSQPVAEGKGEPAFAGNSPEKPVGGEPLVQILITVRNILMLIGLFHLIFFLANTEHEPDRVGNACPPHRGRGKATRRGRSDG